MLMTEIKYSMAQDYLKCTAQCRNEKCSLNNRKRALGVKHPNCTKLVLSEVLPESKISPEHIFPIWVEKELRKKLREIIKEGTCQ